MKLNQEINGVSGQIHRFSVSLVTQGAHRFYSLTLPTDLLARTCFVTTREDDPELGFQRMLDKKRAQAIADYIDTGLGTIPNAIVLSAQPNARLRDIGKGKTIEFAADKKAFLIIDGQHRVFGFSLAKKTLRVPVVIYNGLSKKDESRLFIDINTKQKPVPPELLLDIKRLAEYESDVESFCSDLFDRFATETASPLIGLLSSSKRVRGRMSRVTFYAGVKPLFSIFNGKTNDESYHILAEYFRAVVAGLAGIGLTDGIALPVVFRAFIGIFPEIAGRVKDRGKEYRSDNFSAVLSSIFDSITKSMLERASSVGELSEQLSGFMRRSFAL